MGERPALRRIGINLAVLLAYAGVAVGTTWPLAARANTHLLAGSWDNLVHYWNGWWAQQALTTGQSPFYTETFSVDYEKNALLLGHAGYHDTSNADPGYPVQIVADVEYENSDTFAGAVSFFKYRAGPVTVVNSVWDGQRLKWVAFEGQSLPGPPKMDGNRTKTRFFLYLIFSPFLTLKVYKYKNCRVLLFHIASAQLSIY